MVRRQSGIDLRLSLCSFFCFALLNKLMLNCVSPVDSFHREESQGILCLRASLPWWLGSNSLQTSVLHQCLALQSIVVLRFYFFFPSFLSFSFLIIISSGRIPRLCHQFDLLLVCRLLLSAYLLTLTETLSQKQKDRKGWDTILC